MNKQWDFYNEFMAKEILLYDFIYDYSAADIITRLEQSMDDEVSLRVNCGGGNLFSAWGMFAKTQEHGEVTIKVDGMAASGAAYLCLFAKSVECIDASAFMFHRADGPTNSEEEKQLLIQKNKELKSKMKMRLNEDKFKEVTGMTIDQMFEGEVKDIWLTAKQAKQIGLVKKINKVDPVEMQARTEIFYRIAAELKPDKNQNPTNMTLAEFKAQHPAIYNEAIVEGRALGITAGVKQEKERIEACMVFFEIDPKGVQAAIESGNPLTMKQTAEFMLKMGSKEGLEKLAAAATPPVVTAAVKEQTEIEKNNDKLLAEILVKAGVKGEAKKEVPLMSNHNLK